MNKMGKLVLSALSVVSFAACAVNSTDQAEVVGESEQALVNTLTTTNGFFGSDTLRNVITQAVLESGANLTYLGTGSGNGENCLRGSAPSPGVAYEGVNYCNGTVEQTIAPMSRPLKNPQECEAQHAVGKDAIALWTKSTQTADDLAHDDVADAFCGTHLNGSGKRDGTVCPVDLWSEISPGGSTNPSHPIVLVRRDDASGTTEVFKEKNNCSAFCSNVKVVEDGGPGIGCRYTDDAPGTSSITGAGMPGPGPWLALVTDSVTDCIGKIAASNADVLAYAGLDADESGNKALEIDGVEPEAETIRDGSYYYSRCLFINEGCGDRDPEESVFMDWVFNTDSVRFEEVLEDHEFFACTDLEDPGHEPFDCTCN
ncbi:uncharacterized protein SOCE836_018830 [Sorangium cellulosum]|uniref:PBP domain-containing protein n=2 Tax=Polyangiaceae TaxID=49 RepID=A0A4P2QIM9_SORCE|nr:uncharacterized protein SOCE836_018830 [Sorangium cellulosum]WCQ89179.1 hypothetical protein NQZ70_01866 [Sorangium sp. Soce836]